MKLTLTIIILLFINLGTVKAQEHNFTIHYSLAVNFAGSGSEKQQIAELSNGNLVMYRFEFDSTTMQHQIRCWSVNPMAIALWNKVLAIGQGDSVQLNGSCSVNGDHFILAFTKVLGYGHSTANTIIFDNSGEILESVELNIPNAEQIPVLASTVSGNEYVIGGTFHDDIGQTFVFITRSSSQSFQNSEIYTTDNLHSLGDLYSGENNSLHIVGTHSNRTSDVVFNWTNEAVGKQFPENIILREAIHDSLYGTYYAGSNYTIPSFPKAILLLDDSSGNNWYQELQITSGTMQMSTASDLMFHQGALVLTGYCSNPVPKTFISQFGMEGEYYETKLYNSSHPFNYNAGSIIEHSNGHVYLTELGGVSYTPMNSFFTSFLCLNSNLDNECDGTIQGYSCDSIPVLSEADTIFFQEAGTISVTTQTIFNGILADTIVCHTHLGVEEGGSFDVELYPNPFTKTTTLRLADGFSLDKTRIRCFDVLGRDILYDSATQNEREIRIEFNEVVEGTIFFQLTSGTDVLIKRGILE